MNKRGIGAIWIVIIAALVLIAIVVILFTGSTFVEQATGYEFLPAMETYVVGFLISLVLIGAATLLVLMSKRG